MLEEECSSVFGWGRFSSDLLVGASGTATPGGAWGVDNYVQARWSLATKMEGVLLQRSMVAVRLAAYLETRCGHKEPCAGPSMLFTGGNIIDNMA